MKSRFTLSFIASSCSSCHRGEIGRVKRTAILNRQHWQSANTNPTSTNFGRVTTVTQNYMRFITFATS